MKVEYFGVTDVGKKRTNNEDNFYLDGYYKTQKNLPKDSCSGCLQKDQFLFSVCDGMGGTQCGEEASLSAVKTLLEYQNTDFSARLGDYVKKSNNKICEYRRTGGKSSGTTFTSLFIKNDIAEAVNIGDSRIYLYRNGELKQISHDHTEAQAMVDEGVMDVQTAKKSPAFHVLTQHLGIYEEDLILEPYVVREKIRSGDIYLLCSDGLTDMLEDNDITNVLREKSKVDDMGKTLVSKAVDAGGRDNVTVVVLKIIDNKNTIPTQSEAPRGVSDILRKLRSGRIISVILCAIIVAFIVLLSVMNSHNQSVDNDKKAEGAGIESITPAPTNSSNKNDCTISPMPDTSQ